MGNKYQYLDPDLLYTNKNGVLHNIAGIEDFKVLIAFEMAPARCLCGE
jgi:hypothetical protein